jgi:hypothetical protein
MALHQAKATQWQREKVNTAFYYASSEEYCLATSNIPLQKDQWEKAVKNSSQLTSDLLQSLYPCEDVIVVQALLKIGNSLRIHASGGLQRSTLMP